MSSSVAQPWSGQFGTKRVLKEFQHVSSLIAAGHLPQLSCLTMHEDQVLCWRFRLSQFDEDSAGGRQLNKDLQLLSQRHGQGYLLMQASFPPDFPTHPFFLRVISPRSVRPDGLPCIRPIASDMHVGWAGAASTPGTSPLEDRFALRPW